MSSDAERVIADVAQTLDALGVRWYLFGAQAALLRGSRRLTADVDITVFLGTVPHTRLASMLAAGGFTLRVQSDDEFVSRTRVLPFTHDATRMPVDIVLGAPGIEEYFLTRSEELLIGVTRVPTPLGQDLVVMKLLAGRENDLEDAKALVKAGASLDEVATMVEAIAEGLGEDDIRCSLAELRRRVAR